MKKTKKTLKIRIGDDVFVVESFFANFLSVSQMKKAIENKFKTKDIEIKVIE